MTNNKVIEVAEKYLIFLQKEFQAEIIRQDGEPDTDSPHHLAWMCNEIIQFARENRMGKAFRWLGFVQSAFWILGYSSIEAMKNDNRPDVVEEQPLMHVSV